VIFDVTIIIVLGCQEPCLYKMANLMDKCVGSDCSTHCPLSHLSPSPWACVFPESQQY